MIEILTGDFRQLSDSIEDNSIDAIITDPPYPREYLPLWADLAKIARRVLKPSGFLVSYSGQTYLPQVMAMLGSELEYYWLAGLEHIGRKGQRFEKRIINAMKPILIYCKPPVANQEDWFTDLVSSPQPSKAFHKWGQSVTPFRDLIEKFTSPGDLVFDPFVGGGTTPLACLQTGRNFIGCEIEPDKAEVARQRVNDLFFVPSGTGQLCLSLG